MDTVRIQQLLNERTSINSKTGCWEYQGVNSDGYGQIMIDGRFYYTHVLSAILYLGFIPTPGLFVCHEVGCKSKACWHPAHIYIGNAQTNNRDMAIMGTGKSQNSNVTHCKHGHEFTTENTYWTKSSNGKPRRQCRECKSMNDKKYKGLKLASGS